MTEKFLTNKRRAWLQFLLPALLLTTAFAFFANAQPGTTRKIDPATGRAVDPDAAAPTAQAPQATKHSNALNALMDASAIDPEQAARSVVDDSVILPEFSTPGATLESPKVEPPNPSEPVQAASVQRPVSEPLTEEAAVDSAEPVTEPAADTAAEPTAEAAVETTGAPVAEPTEETTDEPVAEVAAAEQTADTVPVLESAQERSESAQVETEMASSSAQATLEPHVADWQTDAKAMAGIWAKSALAAAGGTVSTDSTVAKPDSEATPITELSRDSFLNSDPTAAVPQSAPAAAPLAESNTESNAAASRVSDPFADTGRLGTFELPKEITLGPNDVVANDAFASLPVGEGFDATISANTQGKLVELGIERKNEDGSPMLDANGRPVIEPLKRGMLVKAGDVLGKQFSLEYIARKEAAIAQLKVAEKEAAKQLEVEVALDAARVAESEMKRANKTNEQMPGSVPEEEVVKRVYEFNRSFKAWKKAIYDLEVKALDVDVKKAEIQIADAQLEERRLISPIDGQVDEIYQNEGQWLREGDDVIRVIRLDKITVEARFDASTALPDRIQGKKATVYASRPGEPLRSFEGVVTYARPILEHNHYKAYAEVQNVTTEGGSWFLTPGQQVHIVVHQ